MKKSKKLNELDTFLENSKDKRSALKKIIKNIEEHEKSNQKTN